MALNFLNNGYFAGKVGIGTVSPDSLLHVSADVTGANTGTITIEGRPTGFLGDDIATIDFHNNGNKRADIRMERGNTANDSQLVFSTSDTGTLNDALIINEIGNVGIGTTSPVAKLDVLGTSGGPAVFDYAYATNAGLRIHGTESAMDIVGTDSGNHASTILLRNGNEGFGLLNNPNLNTLQFRSFTATADGFNIHNTGTNLSSLVDIVTFKKTGNVGIGTTSPSTKLHVAGTTDANIIRVENTSTALSSGDTIGAIQFFNNDTTDDSPNVAASIYATAGASGGSGSLRFKTIEPGVEGDPATEAMIITNGGNVGIGTTSPDSLLQVGANLASDGVAYIGDYNSSFATNFFYRNQTAAQSTVPMMLVRQTNTNDDQPVLVLDQDGTGDILQAFTDTSQVVTIDYEGNVGIGTTNPGYKLSVDDNTVTTVPKTLLQFDSGNIADNGGYNIDFRVSSNNTADRFVSRIRGIRESTGALSQLSFWTESGSALEQRMTIRASGKVGIGTTTPNAKLTIWDEGATFDVRTSGINVHRPSSYGQYGSFSYDGATTYLASTYTGNAALGYGTFVFKQYNNGTVGRNALEIQNDGNFLFNQYAGSALTGTPTYLLGTDASGNVVKTNTVPGSAAGPYLPLAGGTMTGTNGVLMPDNFKLKFGDATTPDLVIHHNGTNSFIETSTSSTGDLYIKAQGTGNELVLQATDDILIRPQGGENGIKVHGNDSVELYFNNVRKLRTTSGGVFVEGEIKIDSALLDNQENTDVDTGTEAIASVVLATYTAAFFDFVIKKGTNVRSGTVYACHDGTSVAFTETSTQDLGDTSDVTLNVVISTIYLQLQATTTSDDWSVKSLIRAI